MSTTSGSLSLVVSLSTMKPRPRNDVCLPSALRVSWRKWNQDIERCRYWQCQQCQFRQIKNEKIKEARIVLHATWKVFTLAWVHFGTVMCCRSYVAAVVDIPHQMYICAASHTTCFLYFLYCSKKSFLFQKVSCFKFSWHLYSRRLDRRVCVVLFFCHLLPALVMPICCLKYA